MTNTSPRGIRTPQKNKKRPDTGAAISFIIEDFVNAVTQKAANPIDVYKACEWTAVALLSELSAMNGGRAFDMPDFHKWQRKRTTDYKSVRVCSTVSTAVCL